MSRETISIGRVGFVNRGEYMDNITYKEWDMVTFEGSSYVLTHKGSVEGTSPTEESYWKCVARKGDRGVAGKSAYQVWLDAGNTGTISAYHDSLKGDKGDKGEKGDKGVAGASVEATSIAVGKYKWEYNEADESMSLFFINQ